MAARLISDWACIHPYIIDLKDQLLDLNFNVKALVADSNRVWDRYLVVNDLERLPREGDFTDEFNDFHASLGKAMVVMSKIDKIHAKLLWESNGFNMEEDFKDDVEKVEKGREKRRASEKAVALLRSELSLEDQKKIEESEAKF